MKTQQFTIEQYAEAKVAAKELGINVVGKTKQVVVDLVNFALENKVQAPAPIVPQEKAKKWFEETDISVATGDTVQIISKTIVKAGVVKEILQNRYAKVEKASPKKGLIRAILLDPKTGEELNCKITLELGKFNKVPEGWVFIQTSTEDTTPAILETPAANENKQQTA